MKRAKLILPFALCLAACGSEERVEEANATSETRPSPVETSGKTEVALDAVPAEVLAAAQSAKPGFVPAEAESETRDGRRYFDLGGRLPDGSEVEFDIMEEDGRWRVVETQRDIDFAAAPAPVREAALAKDAALAPTRVIESVQADGVTIYELYAPEGSDPQGRKVEVKSDGGKAEVLTEEWAH